jgi:Fe-S oxidoreductase
VDRGITYMTPYAVAPMTACRSGGGELKKDPNPEIRRREFMSGGWKVFNVGAFLTLGGFLGGLSVSSAISGYPSAMYCYECRRCATNCPYGWDPSGFLIAARANQPNVRMISRVNIKEYNRAIGQFQPDRFLSLDRLNEMDPLMKVRVRRKAPNGDWETPVTVRVKDALGVYTDNDLWTIEQMRARDAAYLCPLCGHCEPPCPVNLPVRIYIRDLKTDGEFRGDD